MPKLGLNINELAQKITDQAEKKVDTSRIKEIDNQKLDIQKMREELAKRKQKDQNNSKGANC